MVRALFFLARSMQPSVIFIDEIDSLLTQRTENENEGSRRIKTEFLVQFDGTSTSNDDRILVIGATNRPQEIDEAARRRLVKRIYVTLPCEEARKEMIFKLMKDYKNNLSDEDLKEVAKITKGYSGSDMFNLCREASLEPLREIENISNFKCENTRPIGLEDFVRSMKQIKKSVAINELDQYKEWNEIYGSS
jgi:SpoVK/Ycf46/Vps4 family AAA+-type ATPase